MEWGECGLKDALYSMVRFNDGVSEDSVNMGIMELEGSILVKLGERRAYFDYPGKKERIGHEKKASHHHSSILTICFLTALFSVHMTCEIHCKLEWPSILLFGSSFMVT